MPIKLAAVLTIALLAGAAHAQETPFGQPADPKKAQRTIHLDMSDAMRYSPSEIALEQGETVRFAGKRGELGWQFTRAGEFHYACLIPGHFEAGMIGKITVKPS